MVHGNLLARGLSVRMGIHCGTSMCESDLTTGHMDYFGPIVIRAARISGNAAGGQIMCSAAVVHEINAKIFERGPDTEYSEFRPTQAIEMIRQMQRAVIPAGEIKLQGLEIPEVVSFVYPASLLGHQDLNASGSLLPESSSALVKSESWLCYACDSRLWLHSVSSALYLKGRIVWLTFRWRLSLMKTSWSLQ